MADEKKVLILSVSKIKYLPFMKYYIDLLSEIKIKTDVITWNRDNEPDESLPEDIRHYEFIRKLSDEAAKHAKISGFIEFRKFARKIINENKYDNIVILHTMPAILFADILMRDYKNKYIWDYRDKTYEDFAPFKKLTWKIATNSRATVISSDAFRKYLPDNGKLLLTHNLLKDSLQNREVRRDRARKRDVIRIAYWGMIRHYNINIRLIKKIAADKRFELHYYGREQETAIKLKEYCSSAKTENIYFHGSYTNTERYKFAENTDIIHNLYENDATVDAMGNKYYDSVSMYIPQLVNRGSFMAFRAEKTGTGFPCNPDDMSFTDDLYNYYNGIEWDKYESACDIEWNTILCEYDNTRTEVYKILVNE